MYLGGEKFVAKMISKIGEEPLLSEVPLSHYRPIAKSLEYYEKQCASRDEAICKAYATEAYSMMERQKARPAPLPWCE